MLDKMRKKLESESIIVKVIQVENIARQDEKAKLESESIIVKLELNRSN